MKENSKGGKLKIVVLGNKAVGKSSIIRRYTLDDFSEDIQATIGVDYISKKIQVEGESVRLQLWDTAGQQKFRSLVKGYLKNADGCIFVYDIRNINSYLSLSEWISLFENSNNQSSFCMIAGNKLDLCTEKELQQIQKAKEFSHFSNKLNTFQEILCSAKTNQNIQKLFERVALKAFEAHTGQKIGITNLLSKVQVFDIQCCSQ